MTRVATHSARTIGPCEEPGSDPKQALDSLPGVMSHLSDAWRRRGQPNVPLVHYDDMLADLGAEMRRVAAWLGIEGATTPDPPP